MIKTLEELSKFQRDLEVAKQRRIWMILLLTLAVCLGIKVLHHLHILSDTPFHFGILIPLFAAYIPLIQGFNAEKFEDQIQKEIVKKVKDLNEFDLVYRFVSSGEFKETPKHMGIITIYLFSNREKKPEEIIQMHKGLLHNMRLKERASELCLERNFWQYFASLKWLV